MSRRASGDRRDTSATTVRLVRQRETERRNGRAVGWNVHLRGRPVGSVARWLDGHDGWHYHYQGRDEFEGDRDTRRAAVRALVLVAQGDSDGGQSS